MESSTVLDALSELAGALAERRSLDDMLATVSREAVRALAVDAAGMTITDPTTGQTRYLTATDPATLQIEKVQAELREGPCIVAMQRREIVAIDDISRVDDWDRYRAAAIDAGMTAVMGVPLRAGEQVLGAMNIYGRDGVEWPPERRRLAQLLADLASGYVAQHHELQEAWTLTDQLQNALDSRVLIEQAKGILAERHGISVGEAFVRIRNHARSNRLKLHGVAADVIGGSLAL